MARPSKHLLIGRPQLPPLPMVSAWCSDNGGLGVGQVKTESKSNESTAIPELLHLFALKGCIVTIDAMGCQTAIARQIRDQGGDYLLALKLYFPLNDVTKNGW